MKVGFIGLGQMGSAMARNLIKAGHTLIVYNRTRSRAEDPRQLGATVAESPAEAAAGVEVLITMLADDRAIEDVVLGPGQALESLPAGAVHVGVSTISIALSKRLQSAHREKQQHYIAASVFGGRQNCSLWRQDWPTKLSVARFYSRPWDKRHS